MTDLSHTEEKDLVARLCNGDEAAFSSLYLKYANLVFSRIKRLVHDHAAAEELTQDVFFQIWTKRDRFDPTLPFKAILMQTAKGIAINFYKKAIREARYREQLIASGSAHSNEVEEAVFFNETRKILEEAICKLPPQRLRVFTLCKIEGKRYEDVAAELGVSVGTIKDHMAKAMRFLKQEIMVKGESSLLSALFIAWFLD